ncbi:GNAT family N-acetyltransferase [Streptomyces sp. NPDC005799]|uniref:GNAT family N-acetyltransferase n=1 Tax=Streptomyces sp. NPDC005799 TaxID=3154678 RepID=UPI0033E53E91
MDHQVQPHESREWDVRTGMGPVRVTSPVPRETWVRVLEADPAAMVFHLPEWLDCLCTVGGWKDAGRLYRTDEGRELVLPMVCRPARPHLLAVRASLPPGWGTGGILAPGGVRPHEVDLVLADLVAERALRTRLRPSFDAASAWPGPMPAFVSVPRTVHVLDLDGGMDAIWSKRWSANTRRHMRVAESRSEEAGLIIETGNSPRLVERFYDLYLRWLDRLARERHVPPAVMRRRGKRMEPLAKFQAVAAALPGACRVRVATTETGPVAAMITLLHGEVGVYWRGYSDKETAGRLRANYLLHLRAIEEACEVGCRYYEMGESGGIASLKQFKARLGAKEWPLTEYRLEREPLTRLQSRMDIVRGAMEHWISGRGTEGSR